ncbi:putative Ig domain-containing protein, partial [Chloroflexota bacterium]
TFPLNLSGVVVGDIDGQSVPVSVVNGQVTIDQRPLLNLIGDKSVNEGELLTFTILASDPGGDELAYSASNLPEGASFNADTQTFSWTPSTGQSGSYPDVHFEVSDGDLTDSEDITITVSTASSGGGGGGGGGGASDRTPPRVYDILISEVTNTSATITWRTHELSTSQVEYWASPSTLSPLDEKRVLNHMVYLTELSPATTYHYKIMSKDSTGNLAVSDENTFTTLGVLSTFTVNSLEIAPTGVSIGEEITISVLVTNTGEAPGSHEVVLRTDGVAVASRVIELAGGTSQMVTFTTASDSAGVLAVDVNGITGSFVVRGIAMPEISIFNITPNYDVESQKLTFARVIYLVDLYQPMADVELVLKVGLDDEPVEEVSLLSAGQMVVGEATGSADYFPAQGWKSGTYTFEAELYADGEFCASTTEQTIEVAVESATPVVSWAILGAIIIGMLLISFVTVFFAIRHRRFMLGN